MNQDPANPSDARLDPPGGWTILDALGEDPAGRRLAAKSGDDHRFQVVKPHEDDQSSLAFRERLKAKAARAKAIHSNWLVPTLGYTQDADTLFLAEAEMDGVSLAELAGSRRRLDRDAVFEVGECVARGLRELHRHGLVHGWIRPDAVLVTEDNALLRGCGLEHPKGETARPPTFMSPEQLSDDRSLRPQSDFFSLGSTLFAAVVGRGPFVGETDADVADAIRNGRPSFPSADEARLNRNQRLFFAKMLAADPDQRPRSADEVLADLTALRQGEPIERVTAMPPEPERRKPARKPKRKKRRRLLLRLGAVAAMLAITLVVALLGSSRDPDEMSGPDADPETEQETPAPEDGEPGEAAKKVEQEAREEQAGEAYHQAVKFAVEHPLKYDEIIARFDRVAEEFSGTDAALKATKRASDAALNKQSHQGAAFADIAARTETLIEEQRFGEALTAIDRFQAARSGPDGALPGDLAESVKRQASLVRGEAQAAFEEAGKAAGKAIQAGRYEDARDIYQKVARLYGMDGFVDQARKELAILGPLIARREETADERARARIRRAFRATAGGIRKRVQAFQLERAVADGAKLVEELKGSTLEKEARRYREQLAMLLDLKRRVVRKVNDADPKLRSETLGIRAPASVIAAADPAGITLKSEQGGETRRRWTDLSDWERYAIARAVSDRTSARDLVALGLLSLEQGNLVRAAKDLERARRLGGDVDDLLARLDDTADGQSKDDDARPAQMLLQARAHVDREQWLDALAVLIPLKDKYAESNYAIYQKLDEMNRMLARCSGELERADVRRDIAAGVETPLLKTELDGWKITGEGWGVRKGRVSCDNQAEHDVDVLRPIDRLPAYRLTVRCRVPSGRGAMVRVASDADGHYDFWLGLADKDKTGLWYSRGGKVKAKKLIDVDVKAGEWVRVTAVVARQYVRVEIGGRSVLLPNKLETGDETQWEVGLIALQESHVEFEDLRLRVLHEQ